MWHQLTACAILPIDNQVAGAFGAAQGAGRRVLLAETLGTALWAEGRLLQLTAETVDAAGDLLRQQLDVLRSPVERKRRQQRGRGRQWQPRVRVGNDVRKVKIPPNTAQA